MRGGRTRHHIYNDNSAKYNSLNRNESGTTERSSSRIARAEVKAILKEIEKIEDDIIELHPKLKKSRNPGDIHAKINEKKEEVQRLVDKMQRVLEDKSWFGGNGTRKRSTQKKRN